MNLKTTIATTAAALTLAATGMVATSATAQAATPRCGNADLAASFRSTDAGAGHRFGVLKLTNTSGHTCTVRGYGGLSYVGHGDGTQVGASATRDPGSVTTVVLRPGRSAVSEVDEAVAADYSAGTCRPTRVDGFRVYVPDSTVSQYVAHRTTGCASTQVHLISHQPFRAMR